jgi:ribonuclease HII
MNLVVGIDEVGRGCWAGPLVAGAVALDSPIAGLADSKVLSKRQRERLVAEIKVSAVAYGLGWVDAETVDMLGITESVRRAMLQAYQELQKMLGGVEHDIIIDGNSNYLADYPNTVALIKADGTIPAVSAASILAKVARDAYMTDLATSLPGYGFEKHVGYGTRQHIDALTNLGVTDQHRKSYKPIKAILKATSS